MTEPAPPWSHMVGRMAAAEYRTARGRIRYRDPDPLNAGGEPAEGTYEFWYAAPSCWRVEDKQGPLHIQTVEWLHVRDQDGRMQRLPQQANTAWGFSYGTRDVVRKRGRRVAFSRRDDFSVPTGRGVAATVADRAAWEYVLATPTHKPYPLRVTVDDETGAVLRLAVPEANSFVEAVEFVPDCPLEEGAFDWPGPVETTWAEERANDRRAQRWLEEQALPVPRFWPAGLGHFPLEGDPETGAFSTDLQVPESASLARWPTGGEPPGHWSSRTEGRHIHEWINGPWHWALAVAQPLSTEDLQRIMESIPPD